jgi:hypothetical protein
MTPSLAWNCDDALQGMLVRKGFAGGGRDQHALAHGWASSSSEKSSATGSLVCTRSSTRAPTR